MGDVEIGRLMYIKGGCLEQTGAVSSGAWTEMAKLIGMPEEQNDRMDMRSSDVIVLWASNPVASRAGLPNYQYLQCRDAGEVYLPSTHSIRPRRVLTDDYIPIRPGTDSAMLTGHGLCAHFATIPRPILSYQFRIFSSVALSGFDADHMPEGADPKDNYKDYVLGTYDGVPKNAGVGVEICGTPAKLMSDPAVLLGEVRNGLR